MKHRNLILTLIIVLAVIVRFVQLSDIPYPLNGDEKAFGYYAWSIAHFGTDEYGHKFPLYFPSIGDYKYPVYAYFSAPFSYIFGLSPILPRFLSSLASIFMVFIIYKFSSLLFKSETIGLISAFLLAISPWNITFSRTASESNLMTFLSFTGFWFLYQFLTNSKKNHFQNLFLAGIFFLFSFFTYSASRVFIPVLILFLLGFKLVNRNYQKIKPLFVFFLISAISVLVFFLNPSSRARANSISMVSRSETRQEWIDQSAYVLGLGNPTKPLITRLFFNKGTAFLREFTGRYLSHFSPDYLFVSGDIVKLNANHNFGNFYIFEIIFLFIGLVLLINSIFKKDLGSFLIFSAILISPVASSTTVETPSAVRQLVGLPYFLITISLGINFLIKKSKLFIAPFFLLYLYFFCFLVLSLFKIKPYDQPWTTDQGNQELVDRVWQLKNNYKYVFVPNDPYIDFLFYQKISPKNFLSEAKIQNESVGKWYRVSQYQNIIFNADKNCPKTGQKNALYVCIGEEISPFAQIIDTIKYNDNIPKYLLIDFPGTNQSSQSLSNGIKYIKPTEMDPRWPSGIFSDPDQYYIDLIL